MGYAAVTCTLQIASLKKGTCTGLWGASKFKVLWYGNPWEVLLYPHLFWVGRGPKPNMSFHPKENLQGFEMCTVTACKFKHPVARCTDFYFCVSHHSLFLNENTIFCLNMQIRMLPSQNDITSLWELFYANETRGGKVWDLLFQAH